MTNLNELLSQTTDACFRRDADYIQKCRYMLTRTPTFLAIDVSGSMSLHGKIEQANTGKQEMMQQMRNDRRANNSCDFAAVTFNDTVTEVQPFAPLPECKDLPEFQANGRTKLAGAVRKALDMIDTQEQKYHSEGTAYHCPMLWIMTDGRSVGENEQTVREVVAETAARVRGGTLKVFAVAIGDDADREMLAALADGAEPLQVGDREITQVMHQVSESVISVSRDVEYLLHGSTGSTKR